MSTSAPATPYQASPAAIQKSLAQLAQEVLLGAKPGSVSGIPNALSSGELDTTVLTDPAAIEAFRTDLAGQINSQGGGNFAFEDLSERIADIIILTSAQGAGTLELHVIDPYWVILNISDGQGNRFFQTDANGYLWPPIDLNFPSGTGVFWRLCQVRAVLDAQPTQGNLVLTFEDRIVSQLRNVSAVDGGIVQGTTGQTLGGFFKSLVDSANSVLGSSIVLVEMISPADPNYQSPAAPTAPPPGGKVSIPPVVGGAVIGAASLYPLDPFHVSGPTTIAQAEHQVAAALATLHQEQQGLPQGYSVAFLPPGTPGVAP